MSERSNHRPADQFEPTGRKVRKRVPLEQRTTEELSHLFELIADEYNRYFMYFDIYGFDYYKYVPYDSEIGRRHRYIKLVDQIVESCPEKYNMLLKKDYLFPHLDRSDWYCAYYSRSAYYRNKRKALLAFLNCLEK